MTALVNSLHCMFVCVFVCVCVCVGPLAFSLHARKTTLKLTAKTSEEADEWIGSLQDVSINTIPYITNIHIRIQYMYLQRCLTCICMIQCMLNVNTCIHVLLQAIDNCPPIQTITERLVLEMIKVYIYSIYIHIALYM